MEVVNRVYEVRPLPISTQAMFMYVQFCLETMGDDEIVSNYTFTNLITDFTLTQNEWRPFLNELISCGLVKDVMNTIILGTGGKLFPYKETVSEISFPELDNFAAAYKKIAPKYSVAIDAKIRQVYELSAKQALKPVEASIIFNSMYEIIYQEVGASRKWNVKEYGIVKPILKNYGTLTSAKMFLLFLADIEKYFRNGSPNIATFNYCKDRLYLDVKGKLAGKKQLKNNTFTYD